MVYYFDKSSILYRGGRFPRRPIIGGTMVLGGTGRKLYEVTKLSSAIHIEDLLIILDYRVF